MLAAFFKDYIVNTLATGIGKPPLNTTQAYPLLCSAPGEPVITFIYLSLGDLFRGRLKFSYCGYETSLYSL